jgi:hypothetical protein
VAFLLYPLADRIYALFIYQPVECPEGYICHEEYWFMPTLIWAGLVLVMGGLVVLGFYIARRINAKRE